LIRSLLLDDKLAHKDVSVIDTLSGVADGATTQLAAEAIAVLDACAPDARAGGNLEPPGKFLGPVQWAADGLSGTTTLTHAERVYDVRDYRETLPLVGEAGAELAELLGADVPTDGTAARETRQCILLAVIGAVQWSRTWDAAHVKAIACASPEPKDVYDFATHARNYDVVDTEHGGPGHHRRR
jgi:hypothetical protein